MVKMTPKTQTVKDLVEEAKKRIVLLFVCCIGLAYLMSLTSSSVWINIPAAGLVIVLLRCISYDLDACRRNAGHTRASATNNLLQNQSPPSLDVPSQPSREQTDWRRKVDSAVVEAAMDQLTRHLVAEWITDRWYSLITPDQDAPEELIKIMNGVLGEISIRAKDVNLIDLLTSDIVHLVCDHLELFRIIQAHIGEGALSKLSSDERDAKLKLTLASENKLHPALFSAEAERKVLQQFMDGLASLTFKPEDLQCKFFRFIVRELLACAVMRPIMNLASPKFINERIESLALSFTNKDDKLIKASGSETKSRSSRSRSATDHFSGFLDRSISGVELVQLGPGHQRKTPLAEIETKPNGPPSIFPKESKHAYPELSAGVQLTKEIGQHPIQQGSKTNLVTDNYKFQSENAEGMETHNFDGKISQARRSSRGEWAQMLDIISRRKTQALAPEHFENMWTKGRNYKRKENADGLSKPVNNRLLSEAYDNTHARGKPSCGQQEHSSTTKSCVVERHPVCSQQINPGKDTLDTARGNAGRPEQSLLGLHEHNNDDEPSAKHMEIAEDSGSSYTSEDDENSTVTGLGTPGIKVWDSRNSRSGSTSQIRHPLENSESHQRHGNRSQLRYRRLFKTASARKRARSNSHGVDRWQELERTSFYLGDGQDILNSTQEEAVETEDSVDNHEVENHSRVYSGTKASSSADAAHVSCTVNLSSRNYESSHLDATLCSQQLRCKVLGANFVKSGSKTIAVYSISVTDNEHHTWSIKRRFQHFEELHRRLKDSFPEYYLSLPPKRFLSSSLDASFVYERCNLLDKYLKDLLSLPRVAESIEVWDFLSVDSQTYMFFNSLSIIETLSVDLDDGQYGKHVKVVENFMENKKEAVDQNQDKVAIRLTESTSNSATSPVSDESRQEGQHTEIESSMNKKKQHDGVHVSYSGSDSDIDRQRESFHLISSKGSAKNARADPDIFGAAEDASTIPSEWTPPNLSLPILNLVDVIFQLQDGGWIRRQAFWVAKQVLQLGMGDAFDDWLIEKIQLLRNEEIIASAIRRIEQILWPDGIFLTKHPRRGRPPAALKADLSAPHGGATVSLPKGAESEQREGKDNQLLLDQQMEESRRASFVRELMVENAPAALVGLVGRKEYERCAQDIYFFLQSAVCVKQLAYGLLEMLLLAAFPELHDTVNLCHTEKGSFGMIPQTR